MQLYVGNSLSRKPHSGGGGGFWERLIKVTKECLKRVIGRSSLTFDELHTLLIEVEGVINARPLTYIYNDSEGVSYDYPLPGSIDTIPSDLWKTYHCAAK